MPTAAELVQLPALDCAPQLLGAVITRHDDRLGDVSLRVTEVEAYHGKGMPGPVDACSHSRMGMTARNASMWGPPGHWYVYLNYGIHHALNLVCSPEGSASGVLIRSAAVVSGLEAVRLRRGDSSTEVNLARGPGNLAQALGIASRELDGTPALGGARLTIALDPEGPAGRGLSVLRGPRVGVNPEAEGADYPWRFWLADEPSVSAYRAGGTPSSRRSRSTGAAKKSRSSAVER
ncbi:DNA-3-methyladenine glycosylase [Mycetocola reblochoni]|uniref:Putative 3-methyladenine DNA glycosylase n=1 Tax=Mycetocola reblochoni TaxID=331618 RepID=A0A3L6ZL74_9MICO|nr:DNA-3-methyladenine glycosylase [Mycetocola reblochoni]RLP68608.1 DNA-3-methyladenine glycosylase [Mycetocola reblochoni]